MSVLLRSVCIVLALLSLPRVARAQSAIELACEEGVERAVDTERLRAALARDTGVEVRRVATTNASQAPRIRLQVLPRDRAALELIRPDGTRMRRVTALHRDPDERVATLAILATNMIRDESGELLALLRRTPPAPPPPPPPSEIVAAPPPPPAAPTPPPPSIAPPPTAPTRALTPSRPVRPPRLRFGLGALMGSVPSRSGADATFVVGVELAWTPSRTFALGVRDLGASPTQPSNRWNAGGAVFAELGWPLLSWLTPHAQLGVDLRVLGIGADTTRVGVAPMAVLGVRFHPSRGFSIAAQTGLHGVVTDAWATSLHTLPSGAIFWSGGLTIAGHVS